MRKRKNETKFRNFHELLKDKHISQTYSLDYEMRESGKFESRNQWHANSVIYVHVSIVDQGARLTYGTVGAPDDNLLVATMMSPVYFSHFLNPLSNLTSVVRVNKINYSVTPQLPIYFFL